MTDKQVILWKHKPTGECGHGLPLDTALAKSYMEHHSPMLPDFEFNTRPALPEEMGPRTKAS